jgi:hypothetical protein
MGHAGLEAGAVTLGTIRAGGAENAARYHRATTGIVARAGQEGKMEPKPKWEQNNLFGTLAAAVAHLEEWGARGVMVQREDLEAWAAEREELREACAAVNDALYWLLNLHHGVSKGGAEYSPPSNQEWTEALETGIAQHERTQALLKGIAS